MPCANCTQQKPGSLIKYVNDLRLKRCAYCGDLIKRSVNMNWNEVKQLGSAHYKTNSVEPIDLYKAGGILHNFAIGSIIKYAYRNRAGEAKLACTISDMKKIIHYAEMIISTTEEAQEDEQT